MARYFDERAEAEAAATVTPELLDGIAERGKVEVVGPVPDRHLRPEDRCAIR
jgi:hypothetical protein